jgi:GST-like protein
MIDLYTCATPNGQKIHIMLEEAGLEHADHWIDIDKGDQFTSEFLAISPNNKIPAIVDQDGPGGAPVSVFESGAILFYLLGQAHHFNAYAPMNPNGAVVLPYAQARYTNEAGRLYGVLDKQLSAHDYVSADQYTIADMAIFPWCRLHARQNQDINDFPNVKRWFHMISERPAVAGDMGRLEDIVEGFDADSWDAAFGGEQYKRR